MIPTAKAFQLMTPLRGLGWRLSRPELTGEWGAKLAQMEHGRLEPHRLHARDRADDAAHRQKAKEYDRDSVPGDYATLTTPCPNCGGVVRENYRRYACAGQSGEGTDACGFSIGKLPAGAPLNWPRSSSFARQTHRPAGGLFAQSGLALHR